MNKPSVFAKATTDKPAFDSDFLINDSLVPTKERISAMPIKQQAFWSRRKTWLNAPGPKKIS